LVLPFLIRFVPERRLPWVLLFFIALAPILRFTVLGGLAAYVMMPCRADSLMLGVLCAWTLRTEKGRVLLQRHRLLLYSALAILMAGAGVLTRKGAVVTSPMMISWGFTWIALMYACLLLLAVTARQSIVAIVMRNQVLRSLGIIAYGLYLFHQAVHGLCHGLLLNQAPNITTGVELAVSFGALALSIAMAWLSWNFFEKHFVKWSRKWSYRLAPPPTEEGQRQTGGAGAYVGAS
jgi:peptidoglycan/LPS O-acetylase OafA/YrhL